MTPKLFSDMAQTPPNGKKITIRRLLASRCREHAAKTFLIDAETGREYSYDEFLQKVNAVSNYLWKQGIRKEDKVALLLPNSPHFLWSFFGIMQLGAVACPVNTHLKAEEIAYILQNSESRALITSKEYLSISKESVQESKTDYLLSWDNPPADQIVGETKPLNIDTALNKEPPKLLPELLNSPPEPDDVAEIIYTSGTTGKPKGAMLTHHNLIIDARWIARWNRLGENDRAMCVMPLFHVNGQIVTVMTPLIHGGSIVLPQRFSVSKFFPLIERHKVNYVGTVATMLSMLLNRANSPNMQGKGSLKIIFCGSAPVPAEVQVQFEKTFQVPVIEGYGMTETTCRSTFNPLPPPAALKLGENDGYRKIGSVGLPLGNEMRVVDKRNRPLGPHEVGEIVIRGENVTKGYYKNPAATQMAFQGGWFHSGDLGYYDEDGYFYIIDRKTDMIIRGGENIYPREIEETLYSYPAVKDAACIGIPDALYGEEVIAFVVLKDNQKASEEDIIAFCKKQLADFKCPKQIKIISEIPKSSSGKLLRRKLRDKLSNFG